MLAIERFALLHFFQRREDAVRRHEIAGADFIAVSSGVWNHPEGPAAAVKAFNALMR